MDQLVTRLTQGKQLYDKGGAIAAKGAIDRDLLSELLRDPYYRQKPPKSVGREQYGEEFIAKLLEGRRSLPDLIATATAFTASTVALSVKPYTAKGNWDLIAAGGGVHNDTLMAQLAALLPQLTLATTADFGIDVDAKEAIAFALMAHETFHRRPGNVPTATGATHPAILGKLSRSLPAR